MTPDVRVESTARGWMVKIYRDDKLYAKTGPIQDWQEAIELAEATRAFEAGANDFQYKSEGYLK